MKTRKKAIVSQQTHKLKPEFEPISLSYSSVAKNVYAGAVEMHFFHIKTCKFCIIDDTIKYLRNLFQLCDI